MAHHFVGLEVNSQAGRQAGRAMWASLFAHKQSNLQSDRPVDLVTRVTFPSDTHTHTHTHTQTNGHARAHISSPLLFPFQFSLPASHLSTLRCASFLSPQCQGTPQQDGDGFYPYTHTSAWPEIRVQNSYPVSPRKQQWNSSTLVSKSAL